MPTAIGPGTAVFVKSLLSKFMFRSRLGVSSAPARTSHSPPALWFTM